MASRTSAGESPTRAASASSSAASRRLATRNIALRTVASMLMGGPYDSTERPSRKHLRFGGALVTSIRSHHPELVEQERQLVTHLVDQLGDGFSRPVTGAALDPEEDRVGRLSLGGLHAGRHLAGVHRVHA